MVRFAFKTSPQDTTWDVMLEVWRAADEIEVFESGWTSDHFYPMHNADPSCPRLEGWTTLTALAQATRRPRMGTLVTGIHYRHPAVERGQHGGHARRHLLRPTRTGHRGRMERAGIQRLRHRAWHARTAQ